MNQLLGLISPNSLARSCVQKNREVLLQQDKIRHGSTKLRYGRLLLLWPRKVVCKIDQPDGDDNSESNAAPVARRIGY